MRYSSLVNRTGGKGSAAWDIHYHALAQQKAGADIILLTVGDSDFDTPEPIKNAAIATLRAGDTHYTDALGCMDFRRAVARSHRERTAQPVTHENVAILAGTQCGLFCASMCLAQAGDEIVTFDPMFATYEATIRASGAKLVRVPHLTSGGFRPDIDALRNSITSKTRAIFIASPGNPTGCVFNADELSAVADIAIAHDLWVVFDEVYSRLVFEGTHKNIGSLPAMFERTITVSSLSKSFAMTGWRAGWMIAPRELISHIGNLSLAMLYGLPGFVQQAGVEALTNSSGETKRIHNAFRKRRDRLVHAINQTRLLSCEAPQAGMFVLVNISKSGLSGTEFCKLLCDEAGVAVLDGSAFGETIPDYVRMSFAVSDRELDMAIARITKFMHQRFE